MNKPGSFEEQLEAARRASNIKKMLFDGAPTTLVSLIGKKQYRRCARDIYFFTQSTICMKQLAYAILELVIISVFPELQDLMVDLHGKKHIKIVTESGIADQMRLTELILNDVCFFENLAYAC
ncbi:hypothetical protein GOBAR_AA34789 [Gossypium barbadense]|uniref:Sorting nexin C-terminal domain-containing protein n=1 Tax=Gossypium barbadense TaxID=3634 RepID=A0A2P5W4B5_GOSBA|nr:hypothetical protein GOBAR_AA34789 [Gossypium barbadense]